MPNHIRTNLHINGTTEQVTAVRDAIRGTDGIFHFNTILPMPTELDGTTSPCRVLTETAYAEQQELVAKNDPTQNKFNPGITSAMQDELVRKYGTDNWYDWCYTNWGTKWSAYDTNEYEDKYGNLISFETAWSFPTPIIKKLSTMFPEVEFVAEYADENQGYNCGRYIIKNGEFEDGSNGFDLGDNSDISNMFAILVRGYDMQEYCDEQLEYAEEDDEYDWTEQHTTDFMKLFNDNKDKLEEITDF